MRSSSSSSFLQIFIDLTDDQDDQEITEIAEHHQLADCLRDLAVLRARVYDLESENSEIKLESRKMKADLQFAQEELKITREALGQAVVANRQVSVVLSFHCLGSFDDFTCRRIYQVNL